MRKNIEIYANNNKFNSLLNREDFINYETKVKSFIVWFITPEKRYFEEVNTEKLNLAIKELELNNSNPNCVPYQISFKYFLKPFDQKKYIEVSKEIYEYVNYIQNYEYNHELYIARTYLEKSADEIIETYSSKIDLIEYKVIHRENKLEFELFMQNNLTKMQKEIFSKLFYEEKSKKEIAETLGIAPSTLSTHLLYIKNKIKKFL